MSDEPQKSEPSKTALAKVELPEAVARRGINEAQWRTLMNNLYPGAKSESVLMVWDYCAARKLDPLKKPCHIVPMEVKDAKTNRYEWRDVVMPGIYEYRTTAHRTGEYLGHSEPVYGPEVETLGVHAPEWCQITAYRWNAKANQKVPFPVQVFFSEVVATKKDGGVNARWSRAPRQMLTKCAEAAAIREAFPEEIGGEPTADEVDGQRHPQVGSVGDVIDVTPVPVNPLETLSEGLAERIEKAFALLGLTPGMRLSKVNEFLGASASDENAEALLKWCETEYRTRSQKPVRTDDNGRKSVAEPSIAPSADEIF